MERLEFAFRNLCGQWPDLHRNIEGAHPERRAAWWM
jgi:hypothetical protein